MIGHRRDVAVLRLHRLCGDAQVRFDQAELLTDAFDLLGEEFIEA